MYLPHKNNESPLPGLIGTFGGLNKGLSISENEFSDMENLSSDDFPLIGTRERRNTVRYFVKQKINRARDHIVKSVTITDSDLLAKNSRGTLKESSFSRTAPEGAKAYQYWVKINDIGQLENVYMYYPQKYRGFTPCPADYWIVKREFEIRVKIDGSFYGLDRAGVQAVASNIRYRFISSDDNEEIEAAIEAKENDYIIIFDEDRFSSQFFDDYSESQAFAAAFKLENNEYRELSFSYDNNDPSVDAHVGLTYSVRFVKSNVNGRVVFDELPTGEVQGPVDPICRSGNYVPIRNEFVSEPPASEEEDEARILSYFIQTDESGKPIEFYEVKMFQYFGWAVVQDSQYNVTYRNQTYYVSCNIPTAYRCDGIYAFSTVKYNGEKWINVESSEYGRHHFTIGDVTKEFIEDPEESLEDAVFADAQIRRQIVTMGSKVIVFPEMYYVNTVNTKDRGFLYNYRYPLWKEGYTSASSIKLTPCSLDGKEMNAQSMGKTAPSKPENGDIWLDISGTSSDYKKYDANSKSWNSIATVYLKISCKGAFKGFRQWDTIFIDGFETGAVTKINRTSIPLSDYREKASMYFGLSDEKFVEKYIEYTEGRISRLGEEDVTYYSSEGVERPPVNQNIVDQIKGLNGKSYVIYQCTNDYIIIPALLDAVITFQNVELARAEGGTSLQTFGKFSFERRVPQLDYYCECGNRIWGCKFGVDEDGNTVNHIMSCKLGDPCNWYSFMGISSDSFDLPVGSDGPFTGCINFNGYPTFFKNKYIHKIYGSTPSTFQLVTNTIRGVGKGMSDSMIICNNSLFYATAKEIVAYDGAGVYSISSPLGKLDFDSCIAGTDQRKLYFVLTDREEKKKLFVFDTELNLWHREDCPDILFFANDGHVLYFIERYYDSTYDCDRYRIRSTGEDVNTVYLQANGWEHGDVYPFPEESVQWWAETGDIGFADPFGKYLQKISVRAKVEEGAEYHIEIAYDGKEFEPITATNQSAGIRARDYVFRIRRCDYFKLRFSGQGKVTFISIYKSYVQGSDKK